MYAWRLLFFAISMDSYLPRVDRAYFYKSSFSKESNIKRLPYGTSHAKTLEIITDMNFQMLTYHRGVQFLPLSLEN